MGEPRQQWRCAVACTCLALWMLDGCNGGRAVSHGAGLMASRRAMQLALDVIVKTVCGAEAATAAVPNGMPACNARRHCCCPVSVQEAYPPVPSCIARRGLYRATVPCYIRLERLHANCNQNNSTLLHRGQSQKRLGSSLRFCWAGALFCCFRNGITSTNAQRRGLRCDKGVRRGRPLLWMRLDAHRLEHQPDVLAIMLANAMVDALALALLVRELHLVVLPCSQHT